MKISRLSTRFGGITTVLIFPSLTDGTRLWMRWWWRMRKSLAMDRLSCSQKPCSFSTSLHQRRQKVDAVKLLMAEAFRGCDQAGIHQVYAFIKDPLFATLISKHFGFEIVDKGELLLREEV